MYTQKPNERSPVYTRTQTNTNEFKKIAHLILLQMKEYEQNQQKKTCEDGNERKKYRRVEWDRYIIFGWIPTVWP